MEDQEKYQTENDVIETNTYTITRTKTRGGKITLHRINDGFNVIELLGLCALTSFELTEQMKNNIKADKVKRTVMVD